MGDIIGIGSDVLAARRQYAASLLARSSARAASESASPTERARLTENAVAAREVAFLGAWDVTATIVGHPERVVRVVAGSSAAAIARVLSDLLADDELGSASLVVRAEAVRP